MTCPIRDRECRLQVFLLDWWRAVRAAAKLNADFDRSGAVDFDGFLIFAGCFNISSGDCSFTAACDLDTDGQVDFRDFTSFATEYGRVFRVPTVTIGWADD
ncbi:MAG: hypothetical protein CME19_14010 [Gemmatimonadetes bacterium]|nr:hypothetical protein [Gemmatimonadota bacterium]